MDVPSLESIRCPVIKGVPFTLRPPDSLLIGSDPGSDHAIKIEGVEGVAPFHAELRWKSDDEAWYLYDDPAPGKTSLNRDPVGSGGVRLYEGYVIDVAGVHFRFSRKSDSEKVWEITEIKGETLRGVCVDVRHLTAKIEDEDAEEGWKTLLDNVSFRVDAGLFTAILGPSGCGKSTLIQRLAGFPFKGDMSGSILFDDEPVSTSGSEMQRCVAYLPQAVEDTFYADLSVAATMEYFARCHLAQGSKIDFCAVLDKVRLKWEDIAAKPVRKLSGGQKRRLALALELMRNPRLLLLDEPTAGLDPAAEADIMSQLRCISGQGTTILCATHVLGSLDECRDVIVMSKGGRVAFHGEPGDAIAFFGGNATHSADRTDCTKSWLGIYRKLTKGKEDDKSRKTTPSVPAKDPHSTLFGGAFLATLSRLGRSVFAKTSKFPFFPNFLLFAAVPIVVSGLLLWACGSMLDNREVGTFYFCMTVAMFWFGLSGTFRNLVSERVPKRCLDRMRGMPLWQYFVAHAMFALISGFVQSFLFVFPIFLCRLGHEPEFTFHAFPAFLLDLGLVGFSGGCVGLLISAWMKKELYAAWILPLVAIPVLFMSKPVLEGGSDTKPQGFLRAIECLMPTMYPQTLLETSMERAKVYHVMPDPKYLNGMSLEGAQYKSIENWTKRPEKRDAVTGEVVKDENGNPVSGESWADKHVSDVLRFFLLMAGYAIACLGMAFIGQRWRERQWDGR